MDQGTSRRMRQAGVVLRVVSIVIGVLGAVKAAQKVQASWHQRRRAMLIERRLRLVRA